MTIYRTEWAGSIKAIDATVETGRKTQAGVEKENYEFGQIPESDYLTCIDTKNDAAYVMLRRGEGTEQQIGCSCQYFKEERNVCEHLYALRDIDADKLDASPGWLVTFLVGQENWEVVDGRLAPPTLDEDSDANCDDTEPVPDGGSVHVVDGNKLARGTKPTISPKKPKAPSAIKSVATCEHCGLVIKASTQELADKRCEDHEKVCKKNPANAPSIQPTPKVDIGVDEEAPVIIDGVPLVDEHGQEVYEKPPPDEPSVEEPVVTTSESQSMIPQKIAEALCNMQKTELFAATDSDNPYFKAKYADLASIWRAIRKPLTDSGLAVMQTTEPYHEGITVVTTLMHVSGVSYTTRLSGTMARTKDKVGNLNKPTVQALGSLITYLRRYSLAALVGVASADDDGEAAMGRDAKNKR